MRILITGGTGLIGSAVTKKLHNQYRLTVLTRHPEKAYKKLGHDIEMIHDLTALTSLDGFDAVINLAGEPIAAKRWTPRQKERITQSRWQLTQQLAALCVASQDPPEVFISGSAMGYYGAQDQNPITESNPRVHDEFSHQLCHQWEQHALAAASDRTRVCLLRTGLVLAPHGGFLDRMKLPFKLGLGGPLGDGTQMMSWIHLDDIVDVIIFLLHNENCQGAYNATAPNPVSNKEFSRTLGEVLHRPVFMRVPAFVLKSALGELSQMLLTGQAVVPERLLDAGFQFRHDSLQDALQHSV